MNEKINELLANKEFVEKLMSLETEAEVQELLSENGVDLTVEQIAMIKKGVASQLTESDELSDDALETVAGGADIGGIIESVAKAIGTLGDYVHKWTRSRW